MKYTNAFGVTINVTPFFDNGCAFQKLQMYEELGGSLARGELWMMLDGTDKSVNDMARDQYTGHLTLEKEEGNIYEVDFFITSRKILNNTFNVSFVCVPNREFYTTLRTSTWDDLSGAISSLFSGPQDIRCESDVNNGVEFYQQRETDHEFCSRLCMSFKHDIVFGFGWEGLLLKETISKDHNEKPEPYYKIYGNQEVSQLTDYNFKYNHLLYQPPLCPWESYEAEDGTEVLEDVTEYESKNCKALRTYGEYRIVGKDHYQALENRKFNQRYLDSNFFTEMIVADTNMPQWKLGDVILYSRRWSADTPDPPFDTFLVKSNEVFYAADSTPYVDQNGLRFSWTSRFLGLKEGGTELNTSDPTSDSEESAL